MSIFETVKQSVTTRQAAERYGIRVERNGMCRCPFHNDSTPSMKLDRRYYCFGCGATGDVIDFVSRLRGIGSKEAAILLVQDFAIPYEDGTGKMSKPRQQNTDEQNYQHMERYCFRVLLDYYRLLCRWKEDYAPRTPEDDYHPRFVAAIDMNYSVTIKGVEMPVCVSLKKMKQVRLKIFPTGEIKLSAPIGTPDEWIAEYLVNKANWIEEKLDLFVQTRAIEKEEHFVSGASTRILGRQLTIQVHSAKRKQVAIEDNELHIYTPESDQQKIDKQVNNWWQQAARIYYQGMIDRLYPIIEKHGIEKPTVCVKKMSTLWGSCSRENKKVNLNFYLYKASVPCVEYVILHELAHFLYPYHNKDFYDFITIHMPDWQERKRQLDYEFVLGI